MARVMSHLFGSRFYFIFWLLKVGPFLIRNILTVLSNKKFFFGTKKFFYCFFNKKNEKSLVFAVIPFYVPTCHNRIDSRGDELTKKITKKNGFFKLKKNQEKFRAFSKKAFL